MTPLTREFLLKRGSCCKNGCKNCPYDSDGNPRIKCRICSEEKSEKKFQRCNFLNYTGVCKKCS